MIQSRNIAFCPETPHQRASIVKILGCLGLALVGAPNHSTICAFKWCDATFSTLTESQLSLLSPVPIYNLLCKDISKRMVSVCHSEIFSRSLNVDPRRYYGPLVSKSNRNAAHDGTVVQGPLLALDPDKIYSQLVNNTDQDEVIDYRVPVFRGAIPFVYIKRRPLAERFSNRNSSVVLRNPSDIFAKTELEQIIKFAIRIGMDFGELDILRDATTGQLSVVDANNTPYGPPSGLSPAETEEAIASMAAAFDLAFIQQATAT